MSKNYVILEQVGDNNVKHENLTLEEALERYLFSRNNATDLHGYKIVEFDEEDPLSKMFKAKKDNGLEYIVELQ